MADDAKDAIPSSRKTWSELMRAAQEGDQKAYSRLLKELVPFLRSAVREKWRTPHDIEDIVQDVLLALHAGRHTYDPKRPFLPWLMAILKHRLADAARRISRKAAYETLIDKTPETFLSCETKTEQESADDRELVRRALASLSASQRRAVELLKIKGLSLQEASAVTGKSSASLKVAVHRAFRAMRRALRETS